MTSWMSIIKWNILRFPIHSGILEFVLAFISSIKKYSTFCTLSPWQSQVQYQCISASLPLPFLAVSKDQSKTTQLLCSVYLDENRGLSWVLAFNSLLKHSVASGRRQLSLTFTAAGIIQKCSGHRSPAASDGAITWHNWYTLRAPGVCVGEWERPHDRGLLIYGDFSEIYIPNQELLEANRPWQPSNDQEILRNSTFNPSFSTRF